MDIKARAQYAMNHFMCDNPEKTREGYRLYFLMIPFPHPKVEHMQWDDGDGTSRCLDAWLYLREMTGDRLTGREVERGQWEYLHNRINPQTGLVYVADLSYPNKKGFYYHVWDQGRTLRHLVNRYTMLDLPTEEKRSASDMIEKMIHGLSVLGCEKELPGFGTAVYWPNNQYIDDTPKPDYRDWAICNGQLLEPVVKYIMVKESQELLLWAIKLANGFLSGAEANRWGSTTPMFGEQGEFFGHLHDVAGGLVGLVLLARLLIRTGMREKGNDYLNVALKAYKWIFSEQNPNRGGSHGWIPEQISPNGSSRISELCCTADMIEYASALASIATLGDEYEHLNSYWDDADRFTRNHLCLMQIRNTVKFERWLKPQYIQNRQEMDAVFSKIRGGWAVGQAWPHDLMDFDTENNAYDRKRVFVWGCCSYSGPRGLFSWWSHAVDEEVDRIDIRLPGDFENEVIRIKEISTGGIIFTLKESRKVSVRIPGTADFMSARASSGNQEVPLQDDHKRNRVILDALSGLEYEIRWNTWDWESYETLGLPNRGHVKNVPLGERARYRLQYKGNTLVRIAPEENAFLPYLEGL